MILITVTHFLLWPKLPLCVSFLPCLPFAIGLYISWILKMLFFMVIWMRRFTWSNLSWVCCSRGVWFNLENLVSLWRLLGWNVVKQIIQFFYCHTSLGKCHYLVVYVDDIVITWNAVAKIFQLKEYLYNHFQTRPWVS